MSPDTQPAGTVRDAVFVVQTVAPATVATSVGPKDLPIFCNLSTGFPYYYPEKRYARKET
jgi:hypothetical protein